MNNSPVDVVFAWNIFAHAFRICFAAAALPGSLLALRLTSRLSLGKTIAAGLLITSVSWLVVAGCPVTLFVPLVISSVLSGQQGSFPRSWLIFPVLFSAVAGASIGLTVLKILRQKVTLSAFWRLTAVNLLTIGLSCYAVERMSRPPRKTWNPDSGRFAWSSGQVTLPAGLTYHGQPSDSFEGYFTSPDERLIVRFDIGGYAGHYAHREDAVFFEERTAENARVWVSKNCRANRPCRIAVTFPDSECANFFVYGGGDADVAVIRSIARSFNPRAHW